MCRRIRRHFALTILFAVMLAPSANADHCSLNPSYPIGDWDGPCLRDNPGNCTSELEFTSPTEGLWPAGFIPDGGTFSSSAPLIPGQSVVLTMRENGTSYVSTNLMDVSDHGCCMSGSWSDTNGSSGTLERCWLEAPLDIVVGIDIKPGSDPNCFNINGHGVIPVAILGSDTLNVLDIDTSALFFAGLEVRMRGKKGPLCHGEDFNGDEFLDLVCQFEDDPTMWTPDSTAEATLAGSLFDGTEFEGTDSICVTQAVEDSCPFPPCEG